MTPTATSSSRSPCRNVPRTSFISPEKYWDLYDPAKISLAPNPYRPKDAPEYAIPPGGELRNYRDIPEGHIPDDLARQLKHGYYAAISYTDAQVGKLLDELDRFDLRKNTIVVFWGDHGWKLGEHDAWCKHSNCENDTNTALLLSVPGMKHAGAKTNSIVEFVDIYEDVVLVVGVHQGKVAALGAAATHHGIVQRHGLIVQSGPQINAF